MNIRKVFFAFTAAVLLCAVCNLVQGCRRAEKEYNLTHRAHNIMMMNDVQIAATDSFIVLVSAFFENGFCRTYSTKGDKLELCGSYGSIGEGATEYRQPVLTFASGNTLGINDINEMTLTLVNIDAKGRMSASERLKAKKPRTKAGEDFIPNDTRYTLLPGTGHYVSLFLKDSVSMFTLSDSRLQKECRFGESPIDGSLSWYGMRNFLNGYMVASGKKFFFATENLPWLVAYSLQDGEMKKQWECFYRTPYYKVSNDAIKYDKGKSTGPLKALCADAKFLYLLYRDEQLSSYDWKDVQNSCSNKVLVYSHDGEFVTTFNLDCYLKSIAIGANGKKLYGIARMPEYTFVEFDLPDYFTRTNRRGNGGSKEKPSQHMLNEAVEVGDTVPYIALYDTLGNVHYLQDFKGKYLLLDFWGSSCGPCMKSIPELKSIADAMSDKMEVVSISGDAKSVWKMASARHGIGWHNLNDLKGNTPDGICTKFNVEGFPTFIIVSPEGVVLDNMRGYAKGAVTNLVNKNVK